MTISKRCVIKSLKSDYLDIVYWSAICLIILGAVYTASWLISIYWLQISTVLQQLHKLLQQPNTPVILFIMIEILAMILVLYWLLFTYPANETPQSFKDGLKESSTTPCCILVTSIIMLVVWGFYAMISWMVTHKVPEQIKNLGFAALADVTMVALGLLAINVFIVCPVAVAIARCRQ